MLPRDIPIFPISDREMTSLMESATENANVLGIMFDIVGIPVYYSPDGRHFPIPDDWERVDDVAHTYKIAEKAAKAKAKAKAKPKGKE